MIIDHHGGDGRLRVQPGDLVVTERLVLRALEVRPVESRQWPDRWKIRTERVALRSQWDGQVPEGARVHLTSRYEPGERPIDHRCGLAGCLGCADG